MVFSGLLSFRLVKEESIEIMPILIGSSWTDHCFRLPVKAVEGLQSRLIRLTEGPFLYML